MDLRAKTWDVACFFCTLVLCERLLLVASSFAPIQNIKIWTSLSSILWQQLQRIFKLKTCKWKLNWLRLLNVLSYLSVTTLVIIGQFSGRYSALHVRLVKLHSYFVAKLSSYLSPIVLVFSWFWNQLVSFSMCVFHLKQEYTNRCNF